MYRGWAGHLSDKMEVCAIQAPGREEAVKKKVFGRIQELYPDIWRNAGLGIYEMEFIYHPPGSLHSGRKLVRIIDKRQNP